MSKLAEFMESQERGKKVGMLVDVDVSCQLCFEYVDQAEYFHVERILKWKCSQGHVSFIEGFRL